MDGSFVSNVNSVISDLDSKVPIALEKIGLVAEGYAKRLCPVGTPESTGKKGYIGGTLRNSISHATDSSSAYIGTNVYYAPYVELGTSRMKERPYLKPAVAGHIEVYKRIIKSTLK